jgi:hypothetical protein
MAIDMKSEIRNKALLRRKYMSIAPSYLAIWSKENEVLNGCSFKCNGKRRTLLNKWGIASGISIIGQKVDLTECMSIRKLVKRIMPILILS